MKRDAAWKLFMETGLPEAYSLYSSAKGRKIAATSGGHGGERSCGITSQHEDLS